jgi:hypothetical protein
MTSTCRQCGTRIGTPVAIGFLTTGLPAAVVAGISCGLLARLSVWFLLAGLPLWIAFTWLFWEGPRWLATLRNRWRRCPGCGAREWSRPKWGGFGL